MKRAKNTGQSLEISKNENNKKLSRSIKIEYGLQYLRDGSMINKKRFLGQHSTDLYNQNEL